MEPETLAILREEDRRERAQRQEGQNELYASALVVFLLGLLGLAFVL